MGMLDLRRLYLREFGNFFARLQLHVGLLPIRTVAREASAAPQFTFEGRGADFLHSNLEKLLDRGLHLGLVGFGMDLETQRSLVVFHVHALFRHQRAHENVINRHFASASENFRAAASLSNTLLWPSRWNAFTSLVGNSVTPFRLRKPSDRLRFSPLSTTSTVRPPSSLASAPIAFFVL